MCVQALKVLQCPASIHQSCKGLQVKIVRYCSGRFLLIAAMGLSKQHSNEGVDAHLALLPHSLHWPAAVRVIRCVLPFLPLRRAIWS